MIVVKLANIFSCSLEWLHLCETYIFKQSFEGSTAYVKTLAL